MTKTQIEKNKILYNKTKEEVVCNLEKYKDNEMKMKQYLKTFWIRQENTSNEKLTPKLKNKYEKHLSKCSFEAYEIIKDQNLEWDIVKDVLTFVLLHDYGKFFLDCNQNQTNKVIKRETGLTMSSSKKACHGNILYAVSGYDYEYYKHSFYFEDPSFNDLILYFVDNKKLMTTKEKAGFKSLPIEKWKNYILKLMKTNPRIAKEIRVF